MNAVSSAVRGDAETKASVAEERGGKSALRRERRRALARQLRLAGLGLGLVTVAAAGAWALRPRPVAVDLVTVSRGPLALVIEESGVTRVQDRFLVSAPVSGSLSRLSFQPGDRVKEGDALAQIAPLSSPLLDPRTRAEAEARLDAAASALGQARAQVARATAAREQSALELDRTRQLSRSGALPPQALEQAEFGLRIRDEELASATFAEKIAKEELRMARVTLDRGSAPSGRDRHVDVLAPASGQVLRVHRESAGAVQAGTALLEVGNPEALEIVVDLLTTDAVRVTPGTRVSIGGWGGSQLEGKVSRVEPSGFTRPSALGVDEQRVNVIVAIMNPRQDWASLGDGYRVEARLVLWQSDTALQVPSGAVFRQGDGWATFRVREGSARLTPVKLGHRGETAVEVVSGLASGDAVVMHPGDRVKDGIDVSAR